MAKKDIKILRMFTITVNDVNQPPVLGLIDPITVDEGQDVTIPETGTDDDV